MDFLEWLVIEECSKKYIEKYSVINELISIINEASNTTGFIEEKLNKSKKNTIKQESWKNKLSKVNWKNILENEEEDDGPVEIESPFSDDENAEPVSVYQQDEEPKKLNKEEKRLNKLKKIKDAMLIIRWNAMKERGESLSDQILSILTPQNVRMAKEDLGNLLYRIKITDEEEEIGSGILSGAVSKAYISSNREFSKSEIFSTFITNLLKFLEGDSQLPERLRNFSDLDRNDSRTLSGIAYYLTRMVINAPKEDARDKSVLNPIGDGSWSDTEAGEGFRRRRDKRATVNSDLAEEKLDFYLKIIDALRNVKIWDENAKKQLKAINPNFYTDEPDDSEGKLRKSIIEDMFIVKLLPDSSINSKSEIKKLLNAYLNMLRSEENEKSYAPIIHASTLRKDDEDGGGGEDIDIARYNNSMGARSSDDFGGATYDDPSRLAADAEEKRLGKESFFEAFKKAMDSLLRDKPNLGLAYCLSKNLDCSSGFPSADNAMGAEKVKAKDVAAKMTEILKTPVSDTTVHNYVNAAKNYIIAYFNNNFPQFSKLLLSLLGK